MDRTKGRRFKSAKEEKEGVVGVEYVVWDGERRGEVGGAVVVEEQVCLSVNGREIANFMCSPNQLDYFALGFLANEGIIDGLHDVAHLHVSSSFCVDVWLKKEFEPPGRMIVTAGCGGGVTFDDLSGEYAPLESDLVVGVDVLAGLMRSMHLGAELYREARGIHTAALATAEGVMMQVEDIGRHNTLDKLRGMALVEGVETQGKILLTSGRISSEMINKARRLGCPIVASRTSPTSLSVKLGEAWGVTIVGYLRQRRMRVYSCFGRVVRTKALRHKEEKSGSPEGVKVEEREVETQDFASVRTVEAQN